MPVSYDDMKTWLLFAEGDAALLHAMWPSVEGRQQEVIDVFYARILASPEARAVFEDDAQIRRQKAVLAVWLKELFNGPWDAAYAERRRRIGERHVQVGLPHAFMFTAMEVLRERLCDIAHAAFPHTQAHAACKAVGRACAMDLALMTGTYASRREDTEVRTARGLLLSHLPAPALVVCDEDKVIEANRAAVALFGEVAVRADIDAVIPRGLWEDGELGQALARGRRDPVVRERVDTDIRGVLHVLRVRVIPLDGVGTRLVHVEDLTDVVRAEARAQRAESLARVGELSAAVAHELRNPLAGISGAIQVLAGSFGRDDRRATVMTKVRDQVGRLDRMVRDLLAFSRPPDVRARPIDLDPIVDKVIELAGEECSGLLVERVGSGRATADADLVHRIVLNLVQNAVAMPSVRRIAITVRDGEVCVDDDGPGVPAALRDRIFEPFFTTRTTGTGLGLAICRSAAEAMGGTLTLDPSDIGASFCLKVPTAG